MKCKIGPQMAGIQLYILNFGLSVIFLIMQINIFYILYCTVASYENFI